MEFGIIKNGVLHYAPKNFINSNGNIIVNFNKNETLMRNVGYKNIVDEKPQYNIESEYIVISGYEDREDDILIKYEVKQIENNESIDEKIVNLQNVDTEHELAIVELANMLMDILGGEENA